MPRSLRFLAPLALLLSTVPAAASPSPASVSSLSSLGASSPQDSAASLPTGTPESHSGHGASGGTSALAAALGLAGVVLVARKRSPAYARSPRRVTSARGATRSHARAARYT